MEADKCIKAGEVVGVVGLMGQHGGWLSRRTSYGVGCVSPTGL